jgi:hydroxymethylglutaryl-CoA lyase
MRQPQRVPMPGLPERVTIYEVGPRDGLQNEKNIVPVEVKASYVARLVAAGLGAVETTSFVHPDWVPQLADAEMLLDALGSSVLAEHPGLRAPVLVPNMRGLARALDRGVREVAVFGSATETFAKRNLNRTYDGQFDMIAPVVAGAREAGLAVRAYVSMCFGDPWEGDVPVTQTVDACVRLMRMGATELSIGDTIGVATPGHVVALLDSLVDAGIPIETIAVHFHDTYGQALSNTITALQRGVRTVDASTGGIGGCPYARSATGNLATEDLVWQLHGLGIDTGVDLAAVVDTGLWIAGQLGRPVVSRVGRALGE